MGILAACMSVHSCVSSALRDQKKITDLLDTGVTSGCQPPHGCWKLSPGPQKEQSVHLATKLSLARYMGFFVCLFFFCLWQSNQSKRESYLSGLFLCFHWPWKWELENGFVLFIDCLLKLHCPSVARVPQDILRVASGALPSLSSCQNTGWYVSSLGDREYSPAIL